jgi:hypothetical protein
MVLAFIAAILTYLLGRSETNDEMQMGALVVAAIVILMTTLFIIAAGFNAMNLTEQKQPLGLPEGSIRAMIALILIMVFIIFGIYLFRMVGQGSFQVIEVKASNPTREDLERYEKAGARATTIETNSFGQFIVRAYMPVADDGKRVAQQLITTVGTLVVAVSGFYFGSSATASQQRSFETSPAGADPESLRAIEEMIKITEDELAQLSGQIASQKQANPPDPGKLGNLETKLESVKKRLEQLRKMKSAGTGAVAKKIV